MKIQLTLKGQGGELDKQVIKVIDDDDSYAVSEAIRSALRAWTLAAGDTIVITEAN